MATLIQLTFPTRKPSTAIDGRTAEVIIFPGVRYERMADAPAQKPKRKRKSRAKQVAQVLVAR